MLGPLTAKIEQELAIGFLDSVSIEQTDWRVTVGEEFEDLRPAHSVVICVEGGTHFHKALLSSLQEEFAWLSLDETQDPLHVLQSDEVNLLSLHGLLHLVLESHDHQVKQNLHRGLV